jgi:hypothetical protein
LWALFISHIPLAPRGRKKYWPNSFSQARLGPGTCTISSYMHISLSGICSRTLVARCCASITHFGAVEYACSDILGGDGYCVQKHKLKYDSAHTRKNGKQ